MSKCINSFRMRNPLYPESSKLEFINAACGKCYYCLANRRQQWFLRLFNEAYYSDVSYFVTLTYADEFCDGFLHPEHFTLFIKRLRSVLDFSYYGIGEYGTHTLRPHYHLILCVVGSSAPVDGLVLSKWRFGNIDCEICNPATINYVLHYHVRPKVPKKGLPKCFQRFSKGIGLSYVFKSEPLSDSRGTRLVVVNKAIVDTLMSSPVRVCSDGIGHNFVIPRYYVKKLKEQGFPIPEPDYVDTIPYQDTVRRMLPDARFRADGTCVNYADSYCLSLLHGLRDISNRKLSRYDYQTKTSL